LHLEILANAFHQKYRKMGVLTDLEEAIHIAEKTLDLLSNHYSEGTSHVCAWRPTFQQILEERYNEGPRQSYSVVEAANSKAGSHPSTPTYLSRLAIQLNHRSSRSRSDPRLWTDLEEFIQLQRKAIAITASNLPTWSFKNHL
jgi:hypothetical protein